MNADTSLNWDPFGLHGTIRLQLHLSLIVVLSFFFLPFILSVIVQETQPSDCLITSHHINELLLNVP